MYPTPQVLSYSFILIWLHHLNILYIYGYSEQDIPFHPVFPFFPLFILFIGNLWGTTYLFPVPELLNTTHYHYLSYGHDFSYTLKQLISILIEYFIFSLSKIDVDFDLEISKKIKKKKIILARRTHAVNFKMTPLCPFFCIQSITVFILQNCY